jgi:hypothetical protein
MILYRYLSSAYRPAVHDRRPGQCGEGENIEAARLQAIGQDGEVWPLATHAGRGMCAR